MLTNCEPPLIATQSSPIYHKVARVTQRLKSQNQFEKKYIYTNKGKKVEIKYTTSLPFSMKQS